MPNWDRATYKNQDNNEDIHSVLLVSFYDVFEKVFIRIQNSDKEKKLELYKRLDQEMSDSECKCFTGRLSRLVSVLVGYFEDIIITISDSEQIANVILMIKTKYPEDKVKEESKR